MREPFAFWGEADNSDPAQTRIGVMSLSNSQATVSINGQQFQSAASLAASASDGMGAGLDSGNGDVPEREDAGYFASIPITGLSPDTVYPYAVTQDGVTLEGELQTDPAYPFTVWYVNCDGRQSGAPDHDGMFTNIRADAEDPNTPKVALLIRHGDLGYADTHQVDDSAGTGYYVGYDPGQVAPEADARGYGYAVAHCNYMGLHDAGTLLVGDAGMLTNQKRFLSPNRLWCTRKLTQKWQVSDHEAYNNGDEEAIKPTHIARAKAAWLNTMGCTGYYINSANSLAWVHKIGDVQFISYDRMTHTSEVVSGGAGNPCFDKTTQAPTGNAFLGFTQIDDITAALDSTAKILVVCAETSLHELMSQSERLAANAEGWTERFGVQEPLGLYNPDEYSRLFLHDGSTTAKGILKFAADNGQSVVAWHGDLHRPNVNTHNRKAALHDANDIAEEWMEVTPGSNTQKGGKTHPATKPRRDYQGSIATFVADWVQYELAGNSEIHSDALRATFHEDRVEMEIHQLDTGVIWEDSLLYGESLPRSFRTGSLPAFEFDE